MTLRIQDIATVDFKRLNIPLILLGLAGLLSSNPLESAFAVIQLYLILRLLWRKDVAPVGVLLFFYPWIEISTGVIEANLQGLSLNDMLHGTGTKAYWLSSIGLMCVLTGFLHFYKKVEFPDKAELITAANRYSSFRLMIAYFMVGPALSVIQGFFSFGSALFQFTTYFGVISVFILIIIVLQHALLERISSTYILFLCAVTALSFYSLFSSWRTVAFALFIGYGTVSYLSSAVVKRILLFAFIFGNLIFLWQGVKAEYRFFITQSASRGQLATQAVRVSQTQALGKFLELTEDFYSGEETDEEASSDLLFSTLRRAGYLEFFSMAMNVVPSTMAHENGQLLKDNLTFALIPRFLNPNKGVKDDGAKVTKYTGFMVGANSSFSLGHYTEYFIDFGAVGMMLVLLIYGAIGGRLYLFISRRASTFISSIAIPALAYIIMDKWGTFQGDAIYIYGRTFFGLICHCLVFIPVYRILEKFCLNTK